jgi:hypothetical protein
MDRERTGRARAAKRWDSSLLIVRVPYAGISRIRFQGVISDPLETPAARGADHP